MKDNVGSVRNVKAITEVVAGITKDLTAIQVFLCQKVQCATIPHVDLQ